MIFIRGSYILKATLNMSPYLDPRAQRVCQIYGAEASYGFAIKAIMKEDSYIMLAYGLMFTMVSLSYQLRLFERKLQ